MSFQNSLRSAARNLHVWAGVTVGVLFCAMGITGSVLVFRADLEQGLRPKWQPKPSQPVASPLAAAERNVLARWPAASVQRLVLPGKAGEPLQVQIRQGETSTHVYCDARTGEVLGTFDLPWLEAFVRLHHEFAIPKSGRQMVGWVGVVLLAASGSGIALWLFRNLRLAASFRVNWRNPKARNLQLHRASGLGASLLLLTQAITGVALGFPATFRAAVESVTGGYTENRPPRAQTSEHGSRAPLDRLAASALAQFPGGSVGEIRLPRNGKGPVTVRIRLPGDARREGANQVLLQSSSAAVLSVDRSADWPLGKRLVQGVTPVHFALWGEWPVKFAWCLAGLALPGLFVSGLLVWWAGLRGKRKCHASVAAQDRATQTTEPAAASSR